MQTGKKWHAHAIIIKYIIQIQIIQINFCGNANSHFTLCVNTWNMWNTMECKRDSFSPWRSRRDTENVFHMLIKANVGLRRDAAQWRVRILFYSTVRKFLQTKNGNSHGWRIMKIYFRIIKSPEASCKKYRIFVIFEIFVQTFVIFEWKLYCTIQ